MLAVAWVSAASDVATCGACLIIQCGAVHTFDKHHVLCTVLLGLELCNPTVLCGAHRLRPIFISHLSSSAQFRAPELVAEVSLTGPSKGEAATACGQVRNHVCFAFTRFAQTFQTGSGL